MGTRMASFSSRSKRRIMACTPWLALSFRLRLQGYPSLSSMPCRIFYNASGSHQPIYSLLPGYKCQKDIPRLAFGSELDQSRA